MRSRFIEKLHSKLRMLPVVLVVGILGGTGCQPSDRTPGLWLRGESAESFPSDWAFSDEYREIYLQVGTPYLLPHSVTIWCAQVEGELFVGARKPASKNWPGWADSNPSVVIKVGDYLYDAALVGVEDANEIAQIAQAYSSKYQLDTGSGDTPPPMRYWRVTPQ